MAEIVVDVSARLKVLQSSVAEMQKILDKLQPNSAGFRTLSTIIATIRKDMDKLQLQTEKPFGSQAQFNQAEKSIDKIEESLGKAQLAIQRIDFKDLKLDDSQKQQFAELSNEIKQIENEFNNLKGTAKNELFQNNDFKAFADSIDSNLIGKSFDEVVKVVTAKANEIDNAVNRAKASLATYSSQVTTGKNIENMLSNGGLTKKGLGQKVFDNFFLTDKNGVTRFKAGKKSEFFEYCKQMFSLTDSQIEEIRKASQDSYSKLQEQFLATDDKGNSKLFGNALKQAQTAANNEVKAQTQLNAAKAEQGGASKAMQALGVAQEKVAQGATVAAEKIDGVNERTRNLQDSCTGAARGMAAFGNGATVANNSLQMLKDDLERVNAEFIKTQRTSQTFNSMKMAIVNFMGFNQVLNMTKRAVKEAMDHIKSLDSVMNGISIVTDMSTSDLWGQVDAYSAMAQKYGVTIQGAYEVSKIYYQQGLETSDVMTLTNETLKLSKISGLDYATTTDYMTTAIRGFKMEMSEASTVVDVYSALAANTAVSQQELAEAMTRTASSMEGVGTSFQDASAMIATIVAVTRESANNIGSAMKSIASRYGELTKDPAKLMDSEGEAMSFNRVDTALQSVGISMKTAEGQFRDFTSVIVELAEKWNTLESTQQRYIATQFAGNRQQSRFLALVSNADLLKANMDVAANSEDTGTLQALKALDSIESKINQVQVAYQQFYTTVGAENIWKGMLDGAENLLNTLNGLPKLFGKIPLNAVAAIANAIGLIKNILTGALSLVAKTYDNIIKSSSTSTASTAKSGGTQVGQSWIQGLLAELRGGKGEVQAAMNDVVGRPQNTGNNTNGQPNIPLMSKGNAQIFKSIQRNEKKTGNDYSSSYKQLADEAYKNGEMSDQIYAKIASGSMTAKQGLQQSINQTQQYTAALEKTRTATEGLNQAQEQTIGKGHKLWEALSSKGSKTQQVFTGISQALTTLGMIINKDTRDGQMLSGVLTGLGGAMQAGMGAAKIAAGDYFSGIMNLFTGLINVINGFDLFDENQEERIERLTKEAEVLSNKAKEEKANYNILNRGIKKLEELESKRYESAEAAEEYQTAVDELASKFPELITGIDAAGNIMIDTAGEAANADIALANARRASATATLKALEAERKTNEEKLNKAESELTGEKTSFLYNSKNSIKKAKNSTIGYSDNWETLYEKLDTGHGNLLGQVPVSYGVWQANPEVSLARLLERIGLTDYVDSKWDDEYQLFVKKADIPNLLDYLFTNSFKPGSLKDQLKQGFLNAGYEIKDKDNYKKLTELQNLISKMEEQEDFFGKDNADNLSRFITLMNEVRGSKAYKEFFGEDSEADKMFDKLSEVNSYKTAIRAGDKQYISSWMTTTANIKDVYSFMGESSQLLELATKSVYDKLKGQDPKEYIQQNKDDINDKLDTYQSFWGTISEDEQKRFNSMAGNSRQYSAAQIIREFNLNRQNSDDTQPYKAIVNDLNEKSNEISKQIFERLKNSTGQLAKTISASSVDDGNILNRQFTQNEEQLIKQLDSQIASREHLNMNVEGLVNNGERLFNILSNYPDLLQLVLNNGITTVEGINSTLSSLKDQKIDDNDKNDLETALTNIKGNILTNISLSIQTITNDLLQNWEDDSKVFKKATSGMDITDVQSIINMATQLGMTDLNFESFKTVGDKLILSTKQMEIFWNKYYDSMKTNISITEGTLNKALQNLTGQTQKEFSKDEKKLTEADFAAIANDPLTYIEDITKILGEGKLKEYFKFDKEGKIDSIINDDKLSQLQQDLAKKANEEISGVQNTYSYIQWIYEQAIKDLVWSQGDYSSLEADLGTEWRSVFEEALKNGVTAEQRKNTPDLKNAVDKAQSAYNSLISDVLSKGFENINLADYEGLLDLGKGIELSGSYQDFVSKYVDFTGKTIEEINALMVQAIEKDELPNMGAADIVRNFKFLNQNIATASLKDLQGLADALGVTLQEWIDAGILDLEKQLADGSYVFDIKKLKDYGWDDISEINNIVADGINDYFNSILDMMSKGLKGTMTNADVTSLNESLQYLGLPQLDTWNSFIAEGAEGLKLSQQAAIALYTELKKIDSYQSKLVFDDLRKSLEDSNENYQSVSSIMVHIASLQKEIDQLKPSDARRKQYEQELSVAKEILAVRSQTDDNSFKFMDQALPGGQNNPLNYYDAMNKANKAISDAFNMKEGGGKGYMGYQDFYNIVTQINQMAAVSKQKIKIGAYTLSGNMQDAANLIQAGASALASVDGGEMKVNLGQLGIDMQAGASQMRNGLNSGLKTMAQEQIKMLDAAIAMLEAIVAMQEIGDIGGIDLSLDINEDGVFDPSDLFNDKGMAKAQQYLDQIALWGEISIDGKGLGAALSDLAKNGEEGAQKVFEFFQELNKMLTDPDFDFSNFSTDFNNLLAKTFNTEKIDISQGIFSKLGINSTDMGKSLYNDLVEAYNKGEKTALSEFVTSNAFKKLPKDLQAKLSAISKQSPKISLKSALNVAALVEEKGVIEKNKDGEWIAKYEGKEISGSPFKTKEAANNAIRRLAQTKYKDGLKDKKDNKFKPPVQAVKVEGLTEVAYMTETSDGKQEATFHGVKMTADTPKELRAKLEKAISDWADGAGSFTYEFGKGKGVTVKTINGIEYRQYFNKNGEITHYIMNGKVYKNIAAFQKFLEEKAKTDTNADVTISDDGNTINVNTNSGVKYKIKIDSDGKEHYYIGNAEYTKKQLDKYLEEQVKAKANGSTISVTKDSDDKKIGVITVTTSSGIQYTIEVNPNGTTTYRYNGKDYTAEQIDTLVKATDLFGKDNVTIDEEGTITANINGKKFEITYDAVKEEYDFQGYTGKTLQEAINNYNKEHPNDQVDSGDKGSEIKIEDGTVVITPDKVVLANIGEDGKIALTENLAAVTGTAKALEILALSVVKAQNFTVTGEDDIWASINDKKEVESFIATVLSLLTQEGNNFTNDEGNTIWQLLSTDKTFPQFTAKVAKLLTKPGETFVQAGEEELWGKIVTTKPFDEFIAYVKKLKSEKNPTNFSTDDEEIWGEIQESKEYDNFTAEVGKILCSEASGFTENSNEIWEEVKETNEYKKFTATVAKIVAEKAASGFNVSAEQVWQAVKTTKEYDNFKARVTNITAEKGFKTINYDNILPAIIDMGVRTGKITIGDVEIEMSDKQKQFIDSRNAVAGLQTTNWSNLSGFHTAITDDSLRTSGLIDKNNLPTKELENYVDQLNKMANSGQQLSEVDLKNLRILGDQTDGILTRSEAGKNLMSVARATLEIGKSNSSDLSNKIDELSKISDLPADNILQLASAFSTLASSGQVLQAIDWATIATGLTSVNDTGASLKLDVTTDDTEDTTLAAVKKKIDDFDTKLSIDANMDPAIATIKAAELPSRTIDVYGNYKGEQQGGTEAKGNVALASGNAMASGTKTLMGELGPELVVSHGRYFVAGQNGAEFVDLDKDAIVFNHLQTESLLKNGKAGRGKAKTNERNAVGMATGNVSGPALAGAQAALANLRQIRAMWESLLSASVQDLAQKGGGGGGGGGGKNGNNAAWLADVERWYNWLQKIAQLEKDINYEETLRSKIQSDRNVNGKAYVDSLVRQLEATKDEEKYQASLADSQEAYFKKRRKEMNNSAFSKFYTFDEEGQLKYTEKSKLKNGDKGGFAALSDLMATNPDGSTKYTAEQQYNKIKAWGFGSTMLYDSSGKKITDENQKKGKHSDEFFTQSVQAFWDKIESDKEEMQKLRDSIDDANTKVLEMEQKRNELIKEMRDNQIDLENKVMDAVQNKLQGKIDEMQKKRDAYDKANQKFIKGLQDSLAREQDMYERQEDKTELSKMRRQLAILQRSGGSASSIASLQNDIREREKDQYFDERQAQIDAIQTASDKQLEKMDLQISIAQETLDYQKRMGLLWSQVYDIMKDPKKIVETIEQYDTGFSALSTLEQQNFESELQFQVDKYIEWQENEKKNDEKQKWNVAKEAIGQSKKYSKVFDTAYKYTDSKGNKMDVDEAAEKAFNKEYERTGDENKARQKAANIYMKAQKQYEKDHPTKPAKDPAKDPAKEPGKDDKNGGKNGTYLTIYVKKGATPTETYKKSSVKPGFKPTPPSFSGWTLDKSKTSYGGGMTKDGKVIEGHHGTVTYYYTAKGGYEIMRGKVDNKRHITDKTTKKSVAGQKYSINNHGSAQAAKKAADDALRKITREQGYKYWVAKYKRGGQVDYTGLAQVDGTPSRPEAFFNAEQTKILKNGLLGNSSRILASALEEFNSIVEGMANGATYNTIDRGSSLVIENASVNMNVQSIANDYDARRAGEQALEQMMKIARKSGTKGVSRR